MSTLHLDLTHWRPKGDIKLPLSKSLCNRALVLAAQFPQIRMAELSGAADTLILQKALQQKQGVIDVGAAGTAMRFATAYFAANAGCEIILKGSARMHQRPIGILVDALKTIGAQVTYLEKSAFPPIKIQGQKLVGGMLGVPATLSSQYISALMLIGPTLEKGLQITLVGNVVSTPYIHMTVGLMNQLGFSVSFSENEITVLPAENLAEVSYTPEPDWSAAAYWYGFMALASEGEVLLRGLTENSLQGDARLVRIFEELGVKTTFSPEGALLQKRAAQLPGTLVINLNDTPDLAQPLAVTCAALGIGADFRGLQTLRIKETDRLLALQTELKKVGVVAEVADSTLKFPATKTHAPTAPFETYEDHRMAMSLALLATKFPIVIHNPEVVSKSYPGFFSAVHKVLG